MSTNAIIEIEDAGIIRLPPELQAILRPHTKVEAIVNGSQVVLSPLDDKRPTWEISVPAQRIALLRQWMASLPQYAGSPLSDQAVGRDSIYD